MKTAVFGGTFNPIHQGHINVIKRAFETIKPDRLILMPTHIPPHKEACDLADDAHRLEMLRIAAKDFENVTVDDYEVKKSGKSYTVDTMEHLKSTFPDDELYFVMGSDMLFTFLQWYKPERILKLCTLAAISRADDDTERIKEYAEKIKEAGGKCVIINCEPVEMSSTGIRADLIAYQSSFGAVPDAVEEYILKNNLYNFDKSKYNSYKENLEKNLSEKRFVHSLNVADEALKLAVLNNCDREKAYFAGLMHDVCKEIPAEEQKALALKSRFTVSDVELDAPKTHHGIAASKYLEDVFGVKDDEILSAVRYHTVAKSKMTTLEKIVYMADLISAERHYKDVDFYRCTAHRDLNLGMYEAMKFTLNYSIEKKRTIPVSTLEAYNEYTLYKNSLSTDK